MPVDLGPLGTAGEWIAGATVLKPYLAKIFGSASDELGGLLADPIADWRKRLNARRAERFIRITSSAAQQTERSGINPLQVPDYVALPLLEKATLIDDEVLQEMWASLLANATNPETASNISVFFPTILSNLTPRQAKFLDILFNHSVSRIFVKIRPIPSAAIVNHSRMDDKQLIAAVGNTNFRWQSNDEKASALDNLVTQGVLRRDQEINPQSYSALAGKLFAEGKLKTPYKLPTDVMVHMQDFYQLSVTGAEFVIACRPFDRRP